LAGGGAPGQYARPAAAAADAGLLPAREPAPEAAQCAALAADARRGRLPRGHARRAGLGAALLRHALEADCRRAGAVEGALVGLAVSLPTYVRAYRSRRRRERAHAALAAALQAYYEGRYARAEKEAAAAFEAGPTPGLAALLAARAAHHMRDFERRDRWLERAEEAGEGLQTARLVSRAEFALEERDFAAARNALRDLH